MAPLVHDRYLMIDAARACDLATGAVLSVDGLEDQPSREPRLPPAFLEVLEHGRDGSPRAIVLDAHSSGGWKGAADAIATAGVTRGYVPLAVNVYLALCEAMRRDMADRTLLLLASEDRSTAARDAFLDAAARSPRPHVVVTIRCGRGRSPSVVREAKALYGGAARQRPTAVVSTDVQQQLLRASRAERFVAGGRHAAAERLLRDVAGALTRRSAWAPAAGVLLSLGRLLIERGRPVDAERVFSEAVAAAASGGDEHRAAEARIWLATARTDAGHLTAAESVCRSLLLVAGLPEPLGTWTHAVLMRVLLWQDRPDEALALLDRGLGDLASLGEETEAFIRATRVRLLLRAGRTFDAGVEADELIATTRDSSTARAIALACRLRVLAAAGDVTGVRQHVRSIAAATRLARTPLRLVRARLILVDVLRRAGRHQEADRDLRRLVRVRRAAPPLLRGAIEALAADVRRHSAPGCRSVWIPGSNLQSSAAALVRLAQEEDDDRKAIERLLEATAGRLQATRIDLWSGDAGPATIVLSTGTGIPSTIGERVLDAGIVIGPAGAEPHWQLGLPIRLGHRLIGALVARWPVDREMPVQAEEVLELVGAVAATRVDALLHRARVEAEAATLIPELVGVGRAMTEVRQAVARAALAPFSVLVEGESGVGKELIARAVHYLGPRRERRFCDVNCAALPDELIESELFGHARGAFTGAVTDRVGLFEEAHGGTLFLDEIADLSARAQAKLLRALQQQEIRRVGETFARPVDVRLVAAANRDMRAEAASGRFRQDLLYRVDVIRINVPALRDRSEDIPALAHHFWRTAAERVGTAASLSSGVVSALATYHWPGNVRELQNVMAALAVAAPRRGRVSAGLLPAVISGAQPIGTPRLAEARNQFERRFVEVALARAGGNRAQAARALGLTRQGLLKLIARLNL